MICNTVTGSVTRKSDDNIHTYDLKIYLNSLKWVSNFD